MKKLFSPITNPYIGPILGVAIIIFATMIFLVPDFSEKNKQDQMTQKAIQIVENLKNVRAYYTKYVISDVKKNTNLNIHYDHKEDTNTIPLPATLLHDLSSFTAEDIKVKMLSNYPFPNRKDRILDKYEKESLSWLINNPQEIYTKIIENENSEKTFRLAIADTLNHSSCVQCHNTRLDTPKNDWKLGEVRGIIEVTMPYTQEFILTSSETIFLITLLILLIVILGVHYAVISIKRQKEHKLAKQRLEEEVEERTESLVHANKILNEYKKAVDTSTIVSKTNKKGMITYVNDEFVKISGFTRSELIGKYHNIIRHEDMEKETFKELWETIKTKKTWKGIIKNKRKDGSSYYVSSTIVPILDHNDDIEEFLAIRLDITELIKAQIKTRKADDAKSTFLANMSHEIRTPLNAIIGFSNILCENNSLNTQGQKQAGIIHSSATSLLSIINDILDISKIENGNFDISIDASDLYYISEHVTELFSKKASEKNIKLIFNLDHKIPMCVLTDGVRIRQVLSNLLSNAIKFTPAYGKVSFSINTLNCTNDKVKIRFEVEDTGIGIPEDKVDNVFKPFIQVDHKSNREFQGTGLGLSICSHIVELLDSRIEIQSEVGKGTRFWFDVEFDVCNEQIHTNKQYLSKLNFLVQDTQNDLYHYAKRYLNIFGTINNFNSDANEIIIYSVNKKNMHELKEFRKNNIKPCIFLFEYEADANKFIAKQNEQVLALPFYASKVNDALQELKAKNLNNNEIIIEENINNNDVSIKKDNYIGNILVAEDNSANQELISYVLDEFGVNYTIKDNGKDTYEEIKNNNSYDLILMDINMPVMDGVESLNHIRAYEEENNIEMIPIIALTANAVKGDREKFLKLGMNDYLSKPINTNELKHLFNKFLKKDKLNKKENKEKIVKQIDEAIEDSNEVIDVKKVSSKLGISENIAQLIINKFKNDIVHDLEDLENIINSENINEINEKAHYIKNSCLNVNLLEVCELLQKLENKEIQIDESKNIFHKIKTKLKNIKG